MMNGINEDILRDFKCGSMKALESMYHCYSGRIFNFIQSILNDSSVAEDLTQDVFLHIWDKRANIDCGGNFEGYIFRITKNMVFHYIKRKLLLQNYYDNLPTETETGDHLDEDLDSLFLEEYIMKLIGELPESRRKIFMLYWKQDMSYREIGDRLSISEKTVATQVQRSLHFIRTRMGHVALFAVILALSLL